jgi:hypothetical protein
MYDSIDVSIQNIRALIYESLKLNRCGFTVLDNKSILVNENIEQVTKYIKNFIIIPDVILYMLISIEKINDFCKITFKTPSKMD